MLYSETLSQENIDFDFVQAKNDLKGRAYNRLKISSADTEELQRFLKELFYPKGIGQNKKLEEKLAKIYEEKAGKVFENFSLGENKLKLKSLDDDLKIIRERYEQFSHKKKIQLNTIYQRLNKCEMLLKKIDKLDKITEVQEEIKREAEDLQKNLNDFLINYKEDGLEPEDYIFIEKDENALALVKKIDKSYEKLSVYGIYPKDYGSLFELALGLAQYNIDSMVDLTTKELLEEVEKKVKGSDPVLGDTQFNMQDIIESINFKKDGSVSLNKKKGADSSRFQKMDIIFSFPQGQNKKRDYRISAKNWETSGGFGETNLWYVIQRTFNLKEADAFLKTMGKLNVSKNQLQKAHEFAKMAIFLDTIMGYSQENGWVDTIVLNIRQQKEIIVESVTELLNNMGKKRNKINVIYPASDVRKKGKKISQKTENEDIFKINLIKEYIDMKVSARYHLSLNLTL